MGNAKLRICCAQIDLDLAPITIHPDTEIKNIFLTWPQIIAITSVFTFTKQTEEMCSKISKLDQKKT